mmetsp:Transcript_36891/g.64041  ORF Transcript_36891/g.64041 Transcript_36891/m.64041 type:complete len:80 (-) Transcript_36891:94-333(-)
MVPGQQRAHPNGRRATATFRVIRHACYPFRTSGNAQPPAKCQQLVKLVKTVHAGIIVRDPQVVVSRCEKDLLELAQKCL